MNTEKQFRSWVASRTWVYAKSMPQWPHQYSAINRKRDDPDTILRFEHAVTFVRSHGIKRVFLPTKGRHIYYDLDGLTYWTLWGLPWTILMNRTIINPDWPHHRLVRPRKPEGTGT